MPTTPVAALSRFAQLTTEPAVAVVALIVVDACQGRRFGRLMLDALRASPVVDGATTFAAHKLGENSLMKGLLLHRGAHANS
jgi:hypothetical protein